MKIEINKVPLMVLEIGVHQVLISSIKEGTHKGIDFFSCKFENENGYFIKKFYLSDFGVKYIIQLFKAVDIRISQDEIDTSDLLKKELVITIKEKQFEDCKTKQFRFGNDIVEFMHTGDDIQNDDFYNFDEDYNNNEMQRSDDLDFYSGDFDDFRYGGLKGDEAVGCWLSTN